MQTKRYGAVSFRDDGDGRYLVIAAVPANYRLAAIGAAARLRTALLEKTTPRTGAVAFEWIPGRTRAKRVVCLFRTGDVPNDDAMRAALALVTEAPPPTVPAVVRTKRSKPRARTPRRSSFGTADVGGRV
jgi:hypothetical protein